MKITVEQVGPDALELLMQWRMRVLREVFAEYAPAQIERVRAANEAYYRAHLADGTHTACFAVDAQGRRVGCGGICYYAEMPSPDNPSGSCGYLMNIYALPALRGRGIGRKIVEFLLADARDRQTGKIYLESSEPAKPLYESLGFWPMRDYYQIR